MNSKLYLECISSYFIWNCLYIFLGLTSLFPVDCTVVLVPIYLCYNEMKIIIFLLLKLNKTSKESSNKLGK